MNSGGTPNEARGKQGNQSVKQAGNRQKRAKSGNSPTRKKVLSGYPWELTGCGDPSRAGSRELKKSFPFPILGKRKEETTRK